MPWWSMVSHEMRSTKEKFGVDSTSLWMSKSGAIGENIARGRVVGIVTRPVVEACFDYIGDLEWTALRVARIVSHDGPATQQGSEERLTGSRAFLDLRRSYCTRSREVQCIGEVAGGLSRFDSITYMKLGDAEALLTRQDFAWSHMQHLHVQVHAESSPSELENFTISRFT
nr:hypothetical protein CFP56_16556 [Quercus suber]